MRARALEIDGHKLWYFGSTIARNRVGILVKKELVDQVVEVRHESDCIKLIK